MVRTATLEPHQPKETNNHDTRQAPCPALDLNSDTPQL